jgi:hypothetical protein
MKSISVTRSENDSKITKDEWTFINAPFILLTIIKVFFFMYRQLFSKFQAYLLIDHV